MIVLIIGGGDLASGVAVRLHRSGLRVVMTELAQPLAVRRKASFAEAITSGECLVEDIRARRVNDPADTLKVLQVLSKGQIPVLVDPDGEAVRSLHPLVVVDARMRKRRAELIRTPVNLIIGLGPGFVAGENCHAVIETNRGHAMGRVIWQGSAQADTGIPEGVDQYREERVLRAPCSGILRVHCQIGEHVEAGQVVAEINPLENDLPRVDVTAHFPGVLRGLLPDGSLVDANMKIGDVDPRDDPSYCTLVSDKALAVGGGVLEAILARPEIRRQLWEAPAAVRK